MIRFSLHCVLAATFLVGCTPLPGGTAPAADGSADGLWRGSSTRFQADSRRCPHPRLLTISIVNGGFSYPWQPGNDITVTVNTDGTLTGQAGEVSITGKREAARIVGDAHTQACGLRFSLAKQP